MCCTFDFNLKTTFATGCKVSLRMKTTRLDHYIMSMQRKYYITFMLCMNFKIHITYKIKSQHVISVDFVHYAKLNRKIIWNIFICNRPPYYTILEIDTIFNRHMYVNWPLLLQIKDIKICSKSFQRNSQSYKLKEIQKDMLKQSKSWLI